MKPSPGVVLRICFALLLATAAFGLYKNLPVISGRPLVATATAVRSADQPLRFVIVAPQYDDPFWEQVGAGAREAGGSRSNIEFTGPRRAALDEQVQLLDMATAAQVDGIITQGVPDPRVAQAIAKAVDRGIPVITVGADLPDLPGFTSRRLAYVGSNNYAAGFTAGEELIRRTQGKAVVGIVRGGLGPEEADDRVRGFRDALAGQDEIRIVAVESSDLNRTVAGQKALKIHREHPGVTAFYGTTALDALGVAQSVSHDPTMKGKLVIGWDARPDDEYVVNGTISVVVQEDPAEMGRLAVSLLEAYLRADQRPPAATYIPVSLMAGGGAR